MPLGHSDYVDPDSKLPQIHMHVSFQLLDKLYSLSTLDTSLMHALN